MDQAAQRRVSDLPANGCLLGAEVQGGTCVCRQLWSRSPIEFMESIAVSDAGFRLPTFSKGLPASEQQGAN